VSGRLLLAAALVGAVTVASCDTGPKSGDVAVELVTPQTGLGAVMFAATATEPQTIDTVTAACDGCRVYMLRVSEREVRGVATGAIALGDVLYLTVSDRDLVEAYDVRLMQAADTAYGVVPIAGSQLRLPAP
jgi:hypothetical protein